MGEAAREFAKDRTTTKSSPLTTKIRLKATQGSYQDPLRILIVDDEEAILTMIGIILEKEGYKPIAASNGGKALTILKTEKIDMVVSDIKMGAMDGFELMKNIIMIDPDIPVILISGDYDVSLPYRAFQEGADDFIHKPFSFTALLESMARCGEKIQMDNLLLQAD